jgi:hypothetical protein
MRLLSRSVHCLQIDGVIVGISYSIPIPVAIVREVMTVGLVHLELLFEMDCIGDGGGLHVDPCEIHICHAATTAVTMLHL